MDNTKVVVVGAGLAGLACAHELEARGVGCTLLEPDQGVRGRVQTDVVDELINGGLACGRRAAEAVIRDLLEGQQ